jgi:hypothetical protein
VAAAYNKRAHVLWATIDVGELSTGPKTPADLSTKTLRTICNKAISSTASCSFATQPKTQPARNAAGALADRPMDDYTWVDCDLILVRKLKEIRRPNHGGEGN